MQVVKARPLAAPLSICLSCTEQPAVYMYNVVCLVSTPQKVHALFTLNTCACKQLCCSNGHAILTCKQLAGLTEPLCGLLHSSRIALARHLLRGVSHTNISQRLRAPARSLASNPPALVCCPYRVPLQGMRTPALSWSWLRAVSCFCTTSQQPHGRRQQQPPHHHNLPLPQSCLSSGQAAPTSRGCLPSSRCRRRSSSSSRSFLRRRQ